MRKYFVFLATALSAVMFQGCLHTPDVYTDDVYIDEGHDSQVSELEEKYLSIEGADYNNTSLPSATTNEALYNVDMSTQVMNGAMNYISTVTSKEVDKFYVSVDGVSGYWAYPGNPSSVSDGYYTYIIPVMMSQNYSGESTIKVCAQYKDGEVTVPIEKKISYIETKQGDLEVKLAFSNEKDIDLHLYTPSGEHIYYGNRGGQYTLSNDSVLTYGLDIDSNAGCSIDGINKENIYIPAQLIENGTYTVVVNMYSNCNSSIATSWSVVTRYKGNIITPATGANPASGIYPIGAASSDMTEVMTFTISDGTRSVAGYEIIPNSYKPTPLSDMDEMKKEDESFMH